MQGRQGQEGNGKGPLDRSATAGYRFSNGAGKQQDSGRTGSYRLSDLTGRQPVIPKRPPGMAHVDQPPATPRVARPLRQESRERKPKSLWWWIRALLIFGVVVVVVGVLAYGVTNFFLAVSTSSGSANTAVDFLSSLKSGDYDQAYNDLAPTVTVQLSRSDFTQTAQADDHCFGQVTDYNEVENSAVVANVGGTQTYTYTYSITRSKLPKPYQLQLTLQNDASGSWSVTSYGGDLGPAPPTCK